MSIKRSTRIVVGILIVVVVGTPCRAATIIVDLNGGGDFTEIQPAIDAAADGNEVVVKPGEYFIVESLDFNRLHDPDDTESPPVKNITVRPNVAKNRRFRNGSERVSDEGERSDRHAELRQEAREFMSNLLVAGTS